METMETTPTTRTTLRTYTSYADAQRAVDFLSDEGFAVRHVSIVSDGLRMVEDVTGRKGYGRAALQGAGTGAVTGALIGFFFGLFSIADPLVSGFVLALIWLVLGAIAGALVGVLAHAATGGQRDFSANRRLEAAAYHVLVDAGHADDAERVLARMEH